ncbi:hypothetical protein [Actinophytocola sp.]|uniref:hypothetical protein n=1 Tax=Actinophytocola sp. TaxID=1872138 RepID=UPI003D6B17CB
MKSHRIAAVAGAVLFGALLVGVTEAAAAPAVAPTDVPAATPAPPLPPSPNVAAPATEVEPCVEECEPPDCPERTRCPAPENPCEAGCEPTEEPEESAAAPPADPEPPAKPTGQPRSAPLGVPRAAPLGQPRTDPLGQPRSAPLGVATPSRIDTGEGPGDPVNWWLVGVPALVLLGIAAGGSYVWITRTERGPR